MASFEIAHKTVMKHEGGASYNPDDTGNVVVNGVVTIPTYKGVAPAKHPKWGGWKYVTGCAAQITKMPTYGTPEYRQWVKFLNMKLEEINALQALVLSFYRDMFWKRMGELNEQELATWVYDKDVNTGSRGSRWLQQALGVTVDGIVGGKTIAAANSVADPDDLLDHMKALARQYYTQVAENNPTQKQFLKGWLARV